jgi:hypothetical protein
MKKYFFEMTENLKTKNREILVNWIYKMNAKSEYTKIEVDIQEALKRVTNRARKDNITSDTIWTKLVKEELGDLGDELGNKVCTSGFRDCYNAEWLYDLVWYIEEEEGEQKNWKLIDVPLVVESEWSRNFLHIKYDFEKLLVANAQHRLFICYLWKIERDKFLNYFADAIKKYRLGHSGDRYMIAILEVETKEFVFELLIK